MTAREITKALGGRWHGRYGTALCPVHDDRAPSLSVSEADGKLLVHCHAGSSFEQIAARVSIPLDPERWIYEYG